jgi:hypothetical protein
MKLRDPREKVRQNPRSRAIVGLIPLTVTIAWLVLRVLPGNQAGPFHGIVQVVLTILALLGLSLLWVGVLRLPKNHPQG